MKSITNHLTLLLLLSIYTLAIYASTTPIHQANAERFFSPALNAKNTSQTAEDEYLSSFVRLIKSDKVYYRNKELVFLADHSTHTITTAGVIALCLLAAAVPFGVIAATQTPERNFPNQNVVLGVVSALLAILGVAATGVTIYKTAQHLQPAERKTFITLNKQGLYEWGKPILKWKDLYKIEISTHIIDDSDYLKPCTTRVASFLDKYGFQLFFIASGTEHLPVPFDNFLAVVEYYWNHNDNDN